MAVPIRIRAAAVTLRRFAPADVPAIWSALEESRAHVAPWLPDLAAAADPAIVEAWIRAGTQAWADGRAYDWAITTTDEPGLVLGGCGLSQISTTHGYANLYYWVRTSALGQGIAPIAARQLARFGITELGLQRIEIVVACANEASRRVAEKAGACCEGVLRNRLRLHDTPHDAFMYSLVPADFAPEPPPQSRRPDA